MRHRRDRLYEIAIVIFLFLFVSLLLARLPGGHTTDNRCWSIWCSYIREHGLTKAYHSGTNYLPFYQYILYVFGLLAGSTAAIYKYISYLRLFTLAFDILGLYFIYRWIDRKTAFVILVVFSVLNIAYSYNTLIWGQVDGISASFVFASLYYAWQRKFVLSSIWMILAINMKMQSIVFLPIYGLLFAEYMLKTWSWKTLLASLAVTGLGQVLLLLPFMFDDKPIPSPAKVMHTYTTTYPVISMNAFNFWYWLIRDPFTTPDNGVGPFGLSYKNIGLLLFLLGSFFCLWPLLKRSLDVLLKKSMVKDIVPREHIWLVSAQVALLFFFTNTQMHERYCHPAFIFLTAYAFYSRDFIPYILFSLAYFLNLERVLEFLPLRHEDLLVFSPSFIAVLYGLTIVYLFVRIYRPVEADVNEALSNV